jgi:hypothetical protein
MADSKPIPVRLDQSIIDRLDDVARRMGSNRAATIRFLVQTFIDSYEQEGAQSLPHDWRQVMHGLDGRREGQKKRAKLDRVKVEIIQGEPPEGIFPPTPAAEMTRRDAGKKGVPNG